LVADFHAHVLRLVSQDKMATVLEECATKEQSCGVCFLWAKELDAKDIHKELFPVKGGKCWSCKAIHSFIEIFSQGCLKVTDSA
jgi:hypothetical protein